MSNYCNLSQLDSICERNHEIIKHNLAPVLTQANLEPEVKYCMVCYEEIEPEEV